MRKLNFYNNEYYHIYNRGVDKRDIFIDERDYERFLRSIKEFNSSKVDGGLYRKYLREIKEKNRGEQDSDQGSDQGSDKGSASKLEAEPLIIPNCALKVVLILLISCRLHLAPKTLDNFPVFP